MNNQDRQFLQNQRLLNTLESMRKREIIPMNSAFKLALRDQINQEFVGQNSQQKIIEAVEVQSTNDRNFGALIWDRLKFFLKFAPLAFGAFAIFFGLKNFDWNWSQNNPDNNQNNSQVESVEIMESPVSDAVPEADPTEPQAMMMKSTEIASDSAMDAYTSSESGEEQLSVENNLENFLIEQMPQDWQILNIGLENDSAQTVVLVQTPIRKMQILVQAKADQFQVISVAELSN